MPLLSTKDPNADAVASFHQNNGIDRTPYTSKIFVLSCASVRTGWEFELLHFEEEVLNWHKLFSDNIAWV